MKKIMVVTVTCGEGHNYIAATLKHLLTAQGHEVVVEQLYGFNPKTVMRQNDTFLLARKLISPIYNFFWNKARNRNPDKRDKLYMHSDIKKAIQYLKQKINSQSFDCIMTVHPSANVAVNALIKNGDIPKTTKTVSVLTDYTCHPYWEGGILLDYVIAPHECTISELKYRGYSDKQIKNLGFVLNKDFFNNYNKQETFKKLGLDPDKFTVLITGGGCGHGKTDKLIKSILKCNRDIQIISHNGKNKKMKDKVDSLIRKNKLTQVFNYGVVDSLIEIIKIADCMFCFGGASSLTEALEAGVPMVIRENMIINEKINADIFEKEGIALQLKNRKQAASVVADLFDNPQKIAEIKNNQKKFYQSGSNERIVNFINEILV